MELSIITREMAPCGIDCSRCVRYRDGVVKETSSQLLQALTNYEKMAEMMTDFNPIFKGYPAFQVLLDFFSQANCPGCRSQEKDIPCYPNCTAKGCFREKGVDFCFQCSEYPCTRNGYNEALMAKWRRNNDRMREVGIEQFYTEQKAKPRY